MGSPALKTDDRVRIDLADGGDEIILSLRQLQRFAVEAFRLEIRGIADVDDGGRRRFLRLLRLHPAGAHAWRGPSGLRSSVVMVAPAA